MVRLLRAAGSLLAGALAFLAVAIAVTTVLDPYVWPSALLGLPAGVVAAVATVPLVYLGVTYWRERAAGQPTGRTRRRLRITAAAVAGFVVGGLLVVAVLSAGAVGIATAILLGGLPAGLLSAAGAAYVVARRDRRDRSPPGSAMK